MIRSQTLADEAHSVYSSGKEFAYDHVNREKGVSLKRDSDTRINIKVDAQRRSLRAIQLKAIFSEEPRILRATEIQKNTYSRI